MIARLVHRLSLRYRKSDRDMQEIARGASQAFLLKIGTFGLGFLFNLVLARLLGVEAAGVFFLTLTVITLAVTIGRVGLDNALVRFTAAGMAHEDYGAVAAVSRQGVRLAVAASGLVTLAVIALAPLLAYRVFNDPQLVTPLRLMALAVVPLALAMVYAQLLKGLKRVRDSLSVQGILMPAFTILGALLLVPAWGLTGALWAYVGAACLTMLAGLVLWRQTTGFLKGIEGKFGLKTLLESSRPLFFASLFQLVILWSSTLMIGMWAGSREVAIYAVAARTALLIQFFSNAINTIAAPKFAALYAKGEIAALGKTARDLAKMAALMALPALLVIMLFPDFLMGIFGEGFAEGALLLRILAFGNFINVVTGSVGYLLMMSGNERLMRNNVAICAVMIVLLNLLFLPTLGVLGAALASAGTLIAQNIIALFMVKRALGIWTLPYLERDA